MDTYYKQDPSDPCMNVDALRHMCDIYDDPRLCEEGGTRTWFNVKGHAVTDDMADRCLKLYNQKNSKNFILEEVVKLNILPYDYYCMTFRARDTKSEDIQYFRGVVYVTYGAEDVLLCQIKDDGGVMIPPGHDELYDPMTAYYMACTTDEEDDDHSIVDHEDVYSAGGSGDGSAVGSADVNSCYDVGSTEEMIGCVKIE